MTRGACLIQDIEKGWRGIVFAVGATGRYLYETSWHESRDEAQLDVRAWLSDNGVRAVWLADSAPPREQ